jgi:hypothetical protein
MKRELSCLAIVVVGGLTQLEFAAANETPAHAETDSASQVTEATESAAVQHGEDQQKKKSDAASGGVSTTDTAIINPDGTWAVLESISVGHPRQKRYCTAVASADVVNPGQCGDPVPAGLLYVFTLTLDDLDPPGDAGDERTVEFTNIDCPFGADAREKEVTTTNFFVVPRGKHQIYWLGRAQGPSAAGVDDASLTVVCTRDRLTQD